MRIAVIYDCLYPNTIGGAERWYRNLAERLQSEHEVTYLTRRQWGVEGPQTPFETIAVTPRGPLYAGSGRRNILAPIRFGWGIFWHLLRKGGQYDAIHAASFPYFSVPGAWAALKLRRSRTPLIVDWHEFWTPEYWREYLGPIGGWFGIRVQALCLRLPTQSFVFSQMVERRLREFGHRAQIVRLTGEYAGPERRDGRAGIDAPDHPVVVFAGRHIPEKRVLVIPDVIDHAKRDLPDLQCVILGDGPDTDSLKEKVRNLGLEDAIDVRGRVDAAEVEFTIASASCLLNPSEREGYGVVVVEAASLGTPSILVTGSENAATELVDAGINGYVARNEEPAEIASLVVKVVREGNTLRDSTQAWYFENRERLSLSNSIEQVEKTYAQLSEATGQESRRSS